VIKKVYYNYSADKVLAEMNRKTEREKQGNE